MLDNNKDLRELLFKELSYDPDKYQQFIGLMKYALKDLMRLEQKARANNLNDFPIIFSGKKNKDEVENDIIEYVIENLRDYVDIHGLGMTFFDNVKISYWVGMYVYETFNSFYGLRMLQINITYEIFDSTGIEVDKIMINKVEDIVDRGQNIFFKYYGRFGLYHSLKHSQRTLELLAKNN